MEGSEASSPLSPWPSPPKLQKPAFRPPLKTRDSSSCTQESNMGGRVLMRKENLVEKLAPRNQGKKIGKGDGGRARHLSVKDKREKCVPSFTEDMVAATQPVTATQPIQAVGLEPIKTRPTRPSGGWNSEKQVLTLCKIAIFTQLLIFKVKELRASLKKVEVDLDKAHTSRLVLNPRAHSVKSFILQTEK